MSVLPPMDMDADIEHVPTEMIGNEAVIIRNIKKTFSGIGKPTVKAVQVSQDEDKLSSVIFYFRM